VEDNGTYMEDNGTEWNKEDKEDNRSNIKKENIKEKNKHLDFVMLSEEEYNKLIDKY
jgi:hypothetical protein